MLFYSFKNYEEFKELFGIEKRSNGVAVRKNKILLGHLKNRELLHNSIMYNSFKLLHIKDMIELQNVLFKAISGSSFSSDELRYKVQLMDWTFYSSQYQTDDAHGVCVDGDLNSVRYINIEQGKVYKMKAAKFMRAIMLETTIGKILSPSVINWLCGDVFTQMWGAYSYEHVEELQLHVDNDFEEIYNSDNLKGDFHSCMTDQDYYHFYAISVSAKAAYLKNAEGDIVARAVIYTKAKDEEGKIWRLCERQYSTDGDELLKRLLVEKLVQGGHIDGYKTVGASCHDSRAFVDVNGESLSSKKFYIGCNLDEGDDLSYQDSFKWYDICERRAYNYEIPNAIDLDTTDGSLQGQEWDEYHERYCRETTTCRYHGHYYSVDMNDLEDFVFIEHKYGYYHVDDIEYCDKCGEVHLLEDTFYSEITGCNYCCEDCKDAAEWAYKREHWHKSEYEDKYYKYPMDLDEIHAWNPIVGEYYIETIGVDYLESLVEDGEVLEYEGNYYDQWDKETGLPYYIDNEHNENKNESNNEYTVIKEAV